MKLHNNLLSIIAFLAASALATFTEWPKIPKLTLTAYEAAGCKAGKGIGAAPSSIEMPSNQCMGFPLDKSYHAVLATKPKGQTCVLAVYTGAGCNGYPRINDALDVSKAKSCFDTGLPFGWLGGDSEPSWSVIYACNLLGH
ncbi:hypothetical protein MMC07_007890 [Pseudocyphellaria aurata]|nr:hypothetical protein [Pseudocyphellaria aurata]